MDGLFYLTSIVGVGVVMWWVLRHDRVPPDGRIGGLFGLFPGHMLVRRRGLRGWLASGGPAPRKRGGPF